MLAQGSRTFGEDEAGFRSVSDGDEHGGGRKNEFAVDAGIACVRRRDPDFARMSLGKRGADPVCQGHAEPSNG